VFQQLSRIKAIESSVVSGAGDGNRTNTIGQNKALLPAFQFNWSQMESTSVEVVKIGKEARAFLSASRFLAALTLYESLLL
jgi:hypothetical protein